MFFVHLYLERGLSGLGGQLKLYPGMFFWSLMVEIDITQVFDNITTRTSVCIVCWVRFPEMTLKLVLPKGSQLPL